MGTSNSASGNEAFRWTHAGGIMGLGDLPGGDFFSEASDVSGAGSTVVGVGSSASGSEAFIWDAVNGMRLLEDILTDDFGLDLAGWTLDKALGIWDDGPPSSVGASTLGAVPTVSQWGMVVMTFLLLTAGTLLMRRQPAQA